MSKAVLMSIQPYWVFLIIANKMGWHIFNEKTAEVRKSRPKDENWNKVVKIYCSKDKKSFSKIPKEYQPLMKQFLGKVIGEFVCDYIEDFNEFEYDMDALYRHIKLNACIDYDEIYKYLGCGKCGCGWHISNLVIYDKSKELSEFKTFCKSYYDGDKCDDCEYFINGDCYEYDESDCRCNGLKPIKRPPQSWCYVEEMELNR